jgi:chemotaxis protein histidine kinase CheA
MDELYAKFLPQFVSLARARLDAARAVAAPAGPRDDDATKKVVRELHTLAGEAGLLGLKDVVPLARKCEQLAKELQTSRTDADAAGLDAALRQLQGVIEGVAPA